MKKIIATAKVLTLGVVVLLALGTVSSGKAKFDGGNPPPPECFPVACPGITK